jgi:hypothetical protein
MCRIIALGRRDGPLTAEDLEGFQAAMDRWGAHNDHGTGIAWVTETGEFGSVKGGERSDAFFRRIGDLPHYLGDKKVKTLIGHVRLACSGDSCGSGAHTEKGAHPFKSCNEDFVLIHNGWIGEPTQKKIRQVLGDPPPKPPEEKKVIEAGPVNPKDLLMTGTGIRGTVNGNRLRGTVESVTPRVFGLLNVVVRRKDGALIAIDASDITEILDKNTHQWMPTPDTFRMSDPSIRHPIESFDERKSRQKETPVYGTHHFQSGVDSEYLVHLIEAKGFTEAMDMLHDPTSKYNIIVLNKDGSVQAHGDGALVGGGVVAPDGESPDTESPLWLLASDPNPFDFFRKSNGESIFPGTVDLTNYNVEMNPSGFAVDDQGKPTWHRTNEHHYEPRKSHEDSEKGRKPRPMSMINAAAKVYGKFCPACRMSGMSDSHIDWHTQRGQRKPSLPEKERYGSTQEELTGTAPTTQTTIYGSDARTRVKARFGPGGIYSKKDGNPQRREPSKEDWRTIDDAFFLEESAHLRYLTLQSKPDKTREDYLKMEKDLATYRNWRDISNQEMTKLIEQGFLLKSDTLRKHRDRVKEKMGWGIHVVPPTPTSSQPALPGPREAFEQRGAELRKKMKHETSDRERGTA